MQNILHLKKHMIRAIAIFIIVTGVFSTLYLVAAFSKTEKITFWNQPQKGANIFNQSISREDIQAAKAYGMSFIRLAPDKFFRENKDFLIGNADQYTSLNQQDLQTLIRVLDICEQEKMPVVLTMLSLPGSRWRQLDAEGKDDLRLWDKNNTDYFTQCALFWRDLALVLSTHKAVVGYNILNEPHPEKLYTNKNAHTPATQQHIQQQLFDFYALVITGIRSVDQHTPIILDSSAYGDAQKFKHLKVHNDPHVLYSFHMYEPYEYTNNQVNKGRFSYPGIVDTTYDTTYWNKNALVDYMHDVIEFQKRNNISSNRILVGEFGGHRNSPGLAEYFTDLIAIFTEQKWHFAFYAFREDTWDGMDYELGSQKLSHHYWEAFEKGEKLPLQRDSNTPQFSVLKKALHT